ncbi:VCBS domain-containing protein [Halorubrum xinjiangense]|uniref:VCBS domain-containing protein n=1 Tax=Halorubrum xinjiangense TaxID=261291 RepID=UPI003C7009C4
MSAATVTSFDDETTTTTPTSDWTEGTTVSSFNASEDESSRIEVILDAAPTGDVNMEIVDPDSSEVVYSATMTQVSGQTTHYEYNASHDELSELPIDAGETKTFTVKADDAGDESSTAAEINVSIANSNDRSVIRVGDAALNAEDSIVALDSGFDLRGAIGDLFEVDSASVDDEVILVQEDANGDAVTDRTVSYDLAASDVSDAYDTAAEFNDEDGEWMVLSTAFVEGEPVKVYNGAPEDTPEEGHYAVYDESSDVLTVHISDDYDKQSVDISSTGGSSFSVGDVFAGDGLFDANVFADNFGVSDIFKVVG